MARQLPKASPLFELPLRASWYRGGTSKGLIVNTSRLAPFTEASRDAILCSVMGSPDPDGRQIDGMGGGVSSLSKVAVVNAPGRGSAGLARKAGNGFPGVDWAEEHSTSRGPNGWDVVYRFGQVPIKGNVIDWRSTCGNLISAVAHHTIRSAVITTKQLDDRARVAGVDPTQPFAEFMAPITILTANNGNRIIARLPVIKDNEKWRIPEVGECTISGVPGTAPPVVVETPLNVESLLPTGRVQDKVELAGNSITVSIVDAGLPVIFVRSRDLDVELEHLISHPASLDSDPALMQRIEDLRRAASQLSPNLSTAYFPGSAAPKVCLLHERVPYISTGGQDIAPTDYDCLVRAISVGQFHRTIPATTLSALGVASAMSGSLVTDVIQRGRAINLKSVARRIPSWIQASAGTSSGGAISSVSVGQPAGVSSTCVRVPPTSQLPDAILMERTARLLMDGQVMYPAKHASIHQPFIDLSEGPEVFYPAKRSNWDRGNAAWYWRVNKAMREGRKVAASEAGTQPAEDSKREYSTMRPVGPQSDSRRGYSTMRGVDSMQAATNPIHLYRHLLRALQRHNTLQHPHRSSLHKIFRDDFESAIRGSSPIEELTERVEKTILVLLSASCLNDSEKDDRKKRRSIDNSTPKARELLANLASLTYHNLSPTTAFTSKRSPRLVGGSETNSARTARAQRTKPSTADTQTILSIVGGQHDVDDDFVQDDEMTLIMGSRRALPSLSVPPRPRRGPLTGSQSAVWDGQRPDKLLKQAQNRISAAEKIAKLTESLEQVRIQLEAFDPSDRSPEKLAVDKEFKSIRGMLRGMRAVGRVESQKDQADSELKSRLMEVITGAEASGGLFDDRQMGVFCGGSRWVKWRDDKWLPP